MRWAIQTGLCALLAAASCGCGGTGQPYVTPERLDKGLVIVLTGIHGRLWISEDISRGLEQGGVEGAIEICDWTWNGHWLPFYNLGAEERNHQEARRVADRVVAYQKEHPGRPVTLVGYSGGGPMAIWAAEALPKGTRLDGMVLLCTPLAPEYDLRPSLAACRKGAVSFYSQKDTLYMALGTLVFGTMDKQHRVSAGNLGFRDPREERGGDPNAAYGGLYLLYDKLFQVPWREQMAGFGYDGTHLTIGSRDFIAAYVAPLVRAKRWDGTIVDAVAHQRLDDHRPVG